MTLAERVLIVNVSVNLHCTIRIVADGLHVDLGDVNDNSNEEENVVQ